MSEQKKDFLKENFSFDAAKWFEERNEGKRVARYPEGSSISLEEMYYHIKVRHSYDTNCISMTTSAGIARTYETEYKQYAMIRVPKNMETSSINASAYMFDELKKRVQLRIEELLEQAENGNEKNGTKYK